MSGKIYGVDIGTSSIKMCSEEHMLNERNVLATGRNSVIAFGQEAYEMYEKAPDNIKVSFPVKNGVIADLGDMGHIFLSVFEKVNNYKKAPKDPDFFVAIPTDITSVEKRAFFETVLESHVKAAEILVVDTPVAAAVGSGIDIINSHGAVVVDMGAGTCTASIVSMGGVVASKTIPSGGLKADEAIISAVRNEYNLLIGKKTAEKLKNELGTVLKQETEMFSTVFGRNLVSGLPESCKVSSFVIYIALVESIKPIIANIHAVLDNMPPELASSVMKEGIYLSGGFSKVKGLDICLKQLLSIDVKRVKNPEECVARGLKIIATDDKYFDLAYIPDESAF